MTLLFVWRKIFISLVNLYQWLISRIQIVYSICTDIFSIARISQRGTKMRKVKLIDSDFALFDNDISPNEYEFFQKHKEAFRRMWLDQGKKFWLRFVITFRSFSVQYGVIKEFPGKQDNYHAFIEEAFQYIIDEFCEGKANMAKNLVLDIVVVAQHRHSLQFLESKSYAKDPFYNKDTRDVFRRLFGSPGDKTSYVKVYFLLPLYIKFGGSVCHCLRRWLDAPETDSMDDTYWTPTNVDFDKYVDKIEKPKSQVDHGSLVPRDPKLGLHQLFHFPDDYDIDVECYVQERINGAYNKPLFVLDWTFGDPRFYHDYENPLYDPDAPPGSDWRDHLMFIDYYYFRKYVQRTFGKSSTNVNDLFAYNFNASRLAWHPEMRMMERTLRLTAALEKRKMMERFQRGQTYAGYKEQKRKEREYIKKNEKKKTEEDAEKRKTAKKEKKKRAKKAKEAEFGTKNASSDSTKMENDSQCETAAPSVGGADSDSVHKDEILILGQDPFYRPPEGSDEPDPSGPCAMKLSKTVDKDKGIMEINVEKTTCSGTVNEKHVKYFNKDTLEVYKPNEVPQDMKSKYGEPASQGLRLRNDLDYQMMNQIQHLDLNIPTEKPHVAVFKSGARDDDEDEDDRRHGGRRKNKLSGGVNITMTFNTDDENVNTPERKRAFTEAVSDLMKNNMQEPVDLPKALLNRVEQSTRREQARERLRKKQNQKAIKDLKEKIEDCKQKIAEQEKEKETEKVSETETPLEDLEDVKLRKATLEAAEKVYREEQEQKKKMKKKEKQKQKKKTKAENHPTGGGGDAADVAGHHQGAVVSRGQIPKETDQSIRGGSDSEGSVVSGESGQGDGPKSCTKTSVGGKKKKKKGDKDGAKITLDEATKEELVNKILRQESYETVMALDEETKQELVSRILDKAEQEKEDGHVIQFIRHMSEVGQLLMTGKIDPHDPEEPVDYEAKYTDDSKPKQKAIPAGQEIKEGEKIEMKVEATNGEEVTKVADDISDGNKDGRSPRTGSPNSDEEKKKNSRKECASCGRLEVAARTYKKCQKCKQENVKKARYYCCRECQVNDWKIKHKVEHKENRLE